MGGTVWRFLQYCTIFLKVSLFSKSFSKYHKDSFRTSREVQSIPKNCSQDAKKHQDASSSLQNHPNDYLGAFQSSQMSARRLQETSEMLQVSNRLPRDAQRNQYVPQKTARRSQEAPKRSTKGPHSAPQRPKRRPRRPKGLPRNRKGGRERKRRKIRQNGQCLQVRFSKVSVSLRALF